VGENEIAVNGKQGDDKPAEGLNYREDYRDEVGGKGLDHFSGLKFKGEMLLETTSQRQS
jgi:hypothetical protein